jgi:hypothetical protein
MRQITVRLGDYVEEEKRRERRGGRAVVVGALLVAGVIAMSRTSSAPAPPGTPARLSASSAALTFSQQLAGSTSPAQLVRLRNSGGELLSIMKIAANNDAFRVWHDCGGTLAPNESCSAAVVFAPAGAGTQRGAVDVETNAGTTTIAIDGQGQAIPSVDLGATDFGQTQLGAAAERIVRFMNSGPLPLTVTAAASAPFEIAADGCSGTIAPGSACELHLRFRPAAAGAASGELRLAGAGGAVIAKGTLLGTGAGEGLPPSGTPAHLTATPLALDFAPQPAGTLSDERPVRLQNDGGAPLAIVNMTVKGDSFRLANRCGSTVAPNAACNAGVVFAPSAEGRQGGTLTIVTDGGTATVSLSGETPPRAPVVTLDPTDFGRTLLGAPVERAVRFVNNAALPVAVGKAATNAPFVISSDGCRNAKLPPGGSCEIHVQFQPGDVGGVNGELVLVAPRGELVARGVLRGTGFKPAPAHLSTAPNALVFPQQPPGTTSDTRVVQVRNDGGEEMTIRTIAARGEAFRAASRCGNTLAPNEACSIAVAYAPPAAGKHGGTLAIITTGGTAMIPLGGEAPAPTIADLPPTNFGSVFLGTAGNRPVRFVNPGPGTIEIGKAAVPRTVEISVDGCRNAKLAPGRGCIIALQFRPEAVGNMKGELVLVDPQGNVVAKGALFGAGVSPAVALPPAEFLKIDISPREINFHGEPGKQSVAVANVGTMPVTLSVKPETQTRYLIDASQCNGVTLSPGKRCMIVIDGTYGVNAGTSTRIVISYSGRNEFVPVRPK